MSSTETGVAQSGSGSSAGDLALPGPAPPRRLVRDLGDLGSVVARVRHEVLQDHLLDVAVLGLDRGDRLEGPDPLLRRLPDADQDPGGEGIRSSPASRIVSSRFAGCLVGEPWWTTRSGLIDSSIRPWEAVTSRRRVRSSRERTPRFVCGSRPRSRPLLAGPDDVRGEVLVTPLPKALGHLGIDLRALTGEHQELLRVAAHRLVQAALHLIRIVDVRPVRREGAVLAVALARPRERERVVAREGHPAHSRAEPSEVGLPGWCVYEPAMPPGGDDGGGPPPGPGRTTAAAAGPRPRAEPGRAGRRCPPTPAPGRWRAR